MNSYFDPDLTGQAPECLVTNHVLRMYKESQLVKLSMPVYYDSMVIKLAGSDTTLVKDIDYVAVETAETEMAEIKAADSSWDNTLVLSISLINQDVQNVLLQVSYQQLFPDALAYNRYRGVNVELTPAYLQRVNDKLVWLESAVANAFPLVNFEGESLGYRLLDIDVTGASTDNLITDEKHAVDTSTNRNLITPVYGSFFSSSLVVTNATTSVVLVKDTDYRLVSFNATKTKVSTTQDSVFDYIELIKELTGNVNITYQAFGGIPSVDDFKGMYDLVLNMADFLGHNTFMTDQNFLANKNVTNILNKINELESNMRQLMVGATYGDVTSGTSATKKIRAINNDINWWNIATIYTVAGSTDFAYTGIFRFSLALMNSKIQVTGTALVDINAANEDDKLVVKIDNNSANCNAYKIHARIIYNKTPSSYSGAIFQIGIALSDYLEDTIGVEDMSGKESPWKIVPTVTTTVDPQNNALLLPDGTSTWNSTDTATSFAVKKTLILRHGTEINSAAFAVTVNGIGDTVANKYVLDMNVFKDIQAVAITMSTTVAGLSKEYTIMSSPTLSKTSSTTVIATQDTVELPDGKHYTLSTTISTGSTVAVFTRVESEATEIPTVQITSIKLV